MQERDRYAELAAQLIEQRCQLRQIGLVQACLAAVVLGLAIALGVLVLVIL